MQKTCHVYHQGELEKQCNILIPINEIAKKALQQQFENNTHYTHIAKITAMARVAEREFNKIMMIYEK